MALLDGCACTFERLPSAQLEGSFSHEMAHFCFFPDPSPVQLIMQFLQEAESQLASNANNDAQTSDPSAQQPGTPGPGSPMSVSPQGGSPQPGSPQAVMQGGSPQPGSPQAVMPPVPVGEQNNREGTEESMDIQRDKSGSGNTVMFLSFRTDRSGQTV